MALTASQFKLMLTAIKLRLRKKENLDAILASYPNLTEEDLYQIKQSLDV